MAVRAVKMRVIPGQSLRLSLPLGGRGVTRAAMIAIAAFALAALNQPAPDMSVRPTVQARATVRIVSGVQLRFAGPASADAPKLRNAVVRGQGIDRSKAKLYEFE